MAKKKALKKKDPKEKETIEKVDDEDTEDVDELADDSDVDVDVDDSDDDDDIEKSDTVTIDVNSLAKKDDIESFAKSIESLVKALAAVEENLNSLSDRFSKVEEAVEDAFTEGVSSDEEETPDEDASEEVPVEDDDSVEKGSDKESLADSKNEGASSEGADDEIAKVELSDDLKSALDEIKDRLTKIEKQPAPSKVFSPVAVKKADDQETEDDEKIEEIDDRLAKLDKIRKNDMTRYQLDNLADEALDLIDEKKRILASR